MANHGRALRWLIVPLIGLALVAGGCRQQVDRVDPTSTPRPTATALPPTATPTSSPSPSPTARQRAESLATLQAQLTSVPCSLQDIINYSDQVLPLANEHIEAAVGARQLQPWRQDMPEFETGYIAATDRLQRLRAVLAPACAEKAQLKFTSGFELLVDVWDHLGEGEFDIAQRKLTSSFDEIGQATELLTELERRAQPQ